MPKPSEFYVGVMEFFSILLPGALLVAALVVRWAPQDYPRFQPLLSSPGASWVAFALGAYAAGHFLFLLASRLDGLLYDRYRRIRWPREKDDCYRFASAARKAALGDHGTDVPMNTFSWAKALLKLKAPAAAADVERYEADSKFFRSLVVAVPLAWLLVVPNTAWLDALLALLTLMAFVAYADRRYKSTAWAYRYVLVLVAAGPAAAPEASAEI